MIPRLYVLAGLGDGSQVREPDLAAPEVASFLLLAARAVAGSGCHLTLAELLAQSLPERAALLRAHQEQAVEVALRLTRALASPDGIERVQAEVDDGDSLTHRILVDAAADLARRLNGTMEEGS